MTREITGSGSHRFTALMQTERKRRGDFSGLTNGKHFSLLLVVLIFHSCTYSCFIFLIFLYFILNYTAKRLLCSGAGRRRFIVEGITAVFLFFQ